MLVDDVLITVKAGSGGEGAHTYMGFKKGVKVGPSGGDGGRGGSIYLKGSHDISDLSQFQFKKEIKAPNGGKGMPGNHNGKDAQDVIVLVPVGTTAKSDSEEIEINENELVLIAKGGEREFGSYSLSRKDEKQNYNRRGEEKSIRLSLSLIADVGLIGLPNAGKSSLLKKLTNATPKIGDYPFTTLEPNLGTIGKVIIADIPGLIEGASKGIGLGTKFLKHVEKTKILIHCISAADEDPNQSYRIVRKEFERYNEELLEKEEIILITKADLATPESLKGITDLLKKESATVLTASIHDENSLNVLKNTLVALVSR